VEDAGAAAARAGAAAAGAFFWKGTTLAPVRGGGDGARGGGAGTLSRAFSTSSTDERTSPSGASSAEGSGSGSVNWGAAAESAGPDDGWAAPEEAQASGITIGGRADGACAASAGLAAGAIPGMAAGGGRGSIETGGRNGGGSGAAGNGNGATLASGAAGFATGAGAPTASRSASRSSRIDGRCPGCCRSDRSRACRSASSFSNSKLTESGSCTTGASPNPTVAPRALQAVRASEKRSARESASAPAATSGARKRALSPPAVAASAPRGRKTAVPRPRSFTCSPLGVAATKRLSGETLRWACPREARASIPSSAWPIQARIWAGGMPLKASSVRPSSSSIARKAAPSVVRPESRTAGRAGCPRPATAAASFSSSGAPATSRGDEATVISFTATVRPDLESEARRTVPKRVDLRIFSS
jgi:hypothetical protein